MDAQCLVVGHSPLLLGNHYPRVEAAPKRTPGEDQDRERGGAAWQQPSTRWERLENKEDLPWVSYWRQSPAPSLQKVVVPTTTDCSDQ